MNEYNHEEVLEYALSYALSHQIWSSFEHNKIQIQEEKQNQSKKIMATTQRSLSMKLLIDSKTNKVLFAEVGKDVIDFLFGLLTIPVGTIVKLLSKESMVGCIGNLYRSVEAIDVSYINGDVGIKSSLLNPTTAAKITLFLIESSSTTSAAKKYYACSSSYYNNSGCRNYVTDVYGTRCPQCSNTMSTVLSYVGPNSASVAAAAANSVSGGFVKGVVTYTVMDDLTVTPMSTISSITMLNKFHVTDVGSLEERNVNLGMYEGLDLLKASLQSKTVLTDVFIGKKLG